MASLSPAVVNETRGPAIPVACGSRRRRERRAGPFLITEAEFLPEARLGRHYHDRPSVVVATRGACVSAVGMRNLQMSRGDVVVEPAGESHANRFGLGGTDVIIVQPDSRDFELFEPCADFLRSPARIRNGVLPQIARRIHEELRSIDTLSALALEASALDFLVMAARTPGVSVDRQWFTKLVDYMHANFLRSPSIADLSAEAGIHPAHLSREFRRVHHVSPIGYMRRLRIYWAADQIRTTTRSLADISSAAGFADQSHFTRVFRSVRGTTPARYRSLTARRQGEPQ